MLNLKIVLAYGIPLVLLLIYDFSAILMPIPLILLGIVAAFSWYNFSENEEKKQKAMRLWFPLTYAIAILAVLVFD